MDVTCVTDDTCALCDNEKLGTDRADAGIASTMEMLKMMEKSTVLIMMNIGMDSST